MWLLQQVILELERMGTRTRTRTRMMKMRTIEKTTRMINMWAICDCFFGYAAYIYVFVCLDMLSICVWSCMYLGCLELYV